VLRSEVAAIDPDLPLFDVRTVDDLLAYQRWAQRVFGMMFFVFATWRWAWPPSGSYAVTAYAVSQRTREFGIRVALGAPAGHVARLVARQTSLQVVAGLLIGAAGALAVSTRAAGQFSRPREPVIRPSSQRCGARDRGRRARLPACPPAAPSASIPSIALRNDCSGISSCPHPHPACSSPTTSATSSKRCACCSRPTAT
jgi:hypothetical protein